MSSFLEFVKETSSLKLVTMLRKDRNPKFESKIGTPASYPRSAGSFF